MGRLIKKPLSVLIGKTFGDYEEFFLRELKGRKVCEKEDKLTIINPDELIISKRTLPNRIKCSICETSIKGHVRITSIETSFLWSDLKRLGRLVIKGRIMETKDKKD